MKYRKVFLLQHKTFGFLIYLFLVSFFGLFLWGELAEDSAHISPDYPKEDIVQLFLKKSIDEGEYKKILYQTGLGKTAIDKLREKQSANENKNNMEWIEKIQTLQNFFFREVNYTRTKNSLISCEETLVGEDGKRMEGTEFVDIQEGDILITKSSRVYGWRNGHAALVVDAKKGKTVESVVLGENSCIQNISKWNYYPNVMIFRLKGASNEFRKQIADWAMNHLENLPYRFSVGVFSCKEGKEGTIEGTQCAHLVWAAYRQFGYDLDGDEGRIVTPKDLANSDWLEIVQLYGIDPGNPWS